MSEKVYAWHFIKPDKKTRYDNKDIQLQKTLRVEQEKIKLCEYGLHASIKPIDALSFVDWEGAIICRVKLSGKIIHGNDKLVASERKVIWWAEADRTLHEFACWCAEQTLYLFERDYPSDMRPRQAIEAKRRWVRGEISDKELDAAWAAAWDAARAAARAAAWAAAWDAARAAARAAAWAAAGDAARDAARDAQNKQLESMLMALKPERVTNKEAEVTV